MNWTYGLVHPVFINLLKGKGVSMANIGVLSGEINANINDLFYAIQHRDVAMVVDAIIFTYPSHTKIYGRIIPINDSEKITFGKIYPFQSDFTGVRIKEFMNKYGIYTSAPIDFHPFIGENWHNLDGFWYFPPDKNNPYGYLQECRIELKEFNNNIKLVDAVDFTNKYRQYFLNKIGKKMSPDSPAPLKIPTANFINRILDTMGETMTLFKSNARPIIFFDDGTVVSPSGGVYSVKGDRFGVYSFVPEGERNVWVIFIDNLYATANLIKIDITHTLKTKYGEFRANQFPILYEIDNKKRIVLAYIPVAGYTLKLLPKDASIIYDSRQKYLERSQYLFALSYLAKNKDTLCIEGISVFRKDIKSDEHSFGYISVVSPYPSDTGYYRAEAGMFYPSTDGDEVYLPNIIDCENSSLIFPFYGFEYSVSLKDNALLFSDVNLLLRLFGTAQNGVSSLSPKISSYYKFAEIGMRMGYAYWKPESYKIGVDIPHGSAAPFMLADKNTFSKGYWNCEDINKLISAIQKIKIREGDKKEDIIKALNNLKFVRNLYTGGCSNAH